jgi:hypothetical protein
MARRWLDVLLAVTGSRGGSVACMIASSDEPIGRVVNVSSIVAGEYAENELRKDFTPMERVAIGKTLEKAIRKRQGGDRRFSDFKPDPSPACSEAGDTRDRVARQIGFGSGKTLKEVPKRVGNPGKLGEEKRELIKDLGPELKGQVRDIVARQIGKRKSGPKTGGDELVDPGPPIEGQTRDLVTRQIGFGFGKTLEKELPKRHGGDRSKCDPSPNCSKPPEGRTSDLVARQIGFGSGKTLEKEIGKRQGQRMDKLPDLRPEVGAEKGDTRDLVARQIGFGSGKMLEKELPKRHGDDRSKVDPGPPCSPADDKG